MPVATIVGVAVGGAIAIAAIIALAWFMVNKQRQRRDMPRPIPNPVPDRPDKVARHQSASPPDMRMNSQGNNYDAYEAVGAADGYTTQGLRYPEPTQSGNLYPGY